MTLIYRQVQPGVAPLIFGSEFGILGQEQLQYVCVTPFTSDVQRRTPTSISHVHVRPSGDK